jgi:hypothetical protein
MSAAAIVRPLRIDQVETRRGIADRSIDTTPSALSLFSPRLSSLHARIRTGKKNRASFTFPNQSGRG